MQQYKDLVQHIKDNGKRKEDRTGTGTLSIFGYQNRYDLSEGFPLVTLKETYFEGIAHELLWFISGSTNIKYLLDNKVNIWNADAYRLYREQGGDNDNLTYKEFVEELKTDEGFCCYWGDLGPIYGAQWRGWETPSTTDFEGVEYIDQLSNVIEEIKRNPDSRRLIVSGWNVGSLQYMGLPPCHTMFQFYVEDGKLSCQLYQRSADTFLGVPFNVASYALLIHFVAHVCDLEVGEFVHTFGDAHLYLDHLEQVDELLSREPLPLPKLVFKRKVDSIFDIKREDFEIVDYKSHPKIKAQVSVG